MGYGQELRGGLPYLRRRCSANSDAAAKEAERVLIEDSYKPLSVAGEGCGLLQVVQQSQR